MEWLYLFFLNLSLFAASDQKTITQDAIQESIVNQLGLFPQEKIHLHTDRTEYVSGEKIWFKVYVVDAFFQQSPTDSQYAYIELINSSDSLIYRVMVSLDDNGLFHGNIFLSDFIPEGDYTLRAYTRYMENLGDDYFFKRPVRINNLNVEEKQTKKQSNVTYDVSFFPEGGYLTEGALCRVAFKALNRDGTSESITGEIIDREGNRITEANTVYAGMGAFIITPETGKTYYLRCKNQSGQEKRFQLPAAQKTYSIATAYRNERYLVEVKKSPGIPEQPLYLLVHCKGEVLYYDSWNHRNAFIHFSNDCIPSGVIQIVLFDGQMNPVSERLVFNKNDDQAKLVFSSDKPFYQKRENVISEIYVTDPERNPLAGHFSIAVTDDGDVAVDSDYTILSSLLLSSELKGYIESPGYYLQDNAESALALDLLMMTHGWRRYDISEVIRGNYKLPETKYEEMKEISGAVKSLFRGRPVANGEVLLISNQGFFEQVTTDSKGLFSFYTHYPDSVKFFIQAKNEKGGERVELVLNREKFPVLKHISKSQLLPYLNTKITSDDALDFIKKAEQRAQYDEGMRLVQLPEVVITANIYSIPKKDKVRLETFALNSGSDRTIYREDFEKLTSHKVSSVIRMLGGAGILIGPDGSISIRGGGTPLILIDGISMPEDTLVDDITIEEIENIDIFKGPSSTIFGRRGANGAISITTRHGEINAYIDTSFNNATYAPTGYQKPVEFYSPKYDTPELKNSGIPDFRTTIFWKPDLLVSEDGKASFDFYTSDFPTSYSVVIEGLSNDGKIIRQIETIEVE